MTDRKCDALGQYVELIRCSLLTGGFRARISERERNRDFPFNIHNIYRVLFAMEPVLLDGWSAVAAAGPLTAHDERLGTSLRCVRYLHVLLVAASTSCGAAAAGMLEPIAGRALGMRGTPRCFCPGHRRPVPPADRCPPDVALRVASALRQYADVRWLGQHDQGFTGCPPARMPGGELVYPRCFGRLPAQFGHRSVGIYVAYQAAGDIDVTFDIFRGELTRTPPRAAVSWCAVVDGDTQVALTGAQCDLMLAQSMSALRAARARLPAGPGDGNPAVADMFMTELLTAAAGIGLDGSAWRARVRARLSEPEPRHAATMTDAYLDRLEQAVQRWSKRLALAAH